MVCHVYNVVAERQIISRRIKTLDESIAALSFCGDGLRVGEPSGFLNISLIWKTKLPQARSLRLHLGERAFAFASHLLE